jgi:hypothetical protein
MAYFGLGLNTLQTYELTFELSFTPDNSAVSPWTYRLDWLASADGGMRRSVSLDGVPEEKNLGDVTVTQLGLTQYMTGPGVVSAFETAACLIAPLAFGLNESFLTPDDLLPPDELSGRLIPDGQEMVAGQAGKHYLIDGGMLGRFSEASGDIVVAEEGGYVLRYDFTGRAVDTGFTEGQAGVMTWHYAITSLEPDVTLDVPPECTPPYPIMPDAAQLVWLGELLSYTSPSSRAEAVAFYEAALPGEGWQKSAPVEEGDETTTLSYSREGKVLVISISDGADGGAEVNLALE